MLNDSCPEVSQHRHHRQIGNGNGSDICIVR